ncbi:hypothetical protein H2248_010332 [Termitomyces sp. 'cryptogamus']|nr:hypothetical protein H2248_010332 [Termitomyces sp. 'cryptogamus']
MAFRSDIGPSLPPELIDLIIDATAEDKETLRVFSVVSKSCLPRCRKYLFRSIEFSTDRGENILAERHESLRSIIARDSQVQTYVEKLLLRDIEISRTPLPWMITNTRFHETLDLLRSHLKCFTLIADDYEWNTFPASLKLALTSIFTSPHLSFIHLQGLQAIPRACCVAFGSQVADLTIVTSDFTDMVDPDLPVAEDNLIPQNLYWLHLEDVNERSIENLLNAWIPVPSEDHDRPLFPHLTALSVGPTHEDALGPIWELVQAGKETIQYFYWDYAYGSQARPLNARSLNLGILQQLFAIKYEVTFYPDDEAEAMPNPPDHFDGLISLLQTVKPGTIQKLDVKIDFKNFHDAVESLRRHDGWSGLDHVLASDSKFDYVDQFIMELDLETLFSEDDIYVETDLTVLKAEMETLLEARLPSLSNSYIFILTVERQRI